MAQSNLLLGELSFYHLEPHVFENTRKVLERLEVISTSPLWDSLDSVTDLVASIERCAQLFVSNCGLLVTKVVDFVAIFVDGVIAWCNETFFISLPTLLVRLFSLFGLGVAVMQVIEWLRVVFCVSDEVRNGTLQAHGVESTEFVPLIIGVIGALTLGTLRPAHEVKKVSETLRLVREFSSMGGLLQNIVRGFAQFLPECMTSWLLAVFPNMEVVSLLGAGGEARTCIEKALLWDNLHSRQRAAYDCEFKQEILAIHESYKCVLLKLAQNSEMPRMFVVFQQAAKILTELRDIVEVSYVAPTFRKEPFSIYTFGEPGVGKSHFTIHMALHLTPQNFLENALYMVNPTLKYHERYTGQFCTIVDEFASLRETDVTSDNSCLALWLRMVTCTALELPTAAVHTKGKKFFSSAVVLVNSNVAHPRCVGVESQDMILRRRHVLLEACVHPSFAQADGIKLDTKKLREHMRIRPNVVCCDSFRHLLFRFRDPNDVRNGVVDDKRFAQKWHTAFETLELIKVKMSEHREHTDFLAEAHRRDMEAFRGGEGLVAHGLMDWFRRPRVQIATEDGTPEYLFTPQGVVEVAEEIAMEIPDRPCCSKDRFLVLENGQVVEAASKIVLEQYLEAKIFDKQGELLQLCHVMQQKVEVLATDMRVPIYTDLLERICEKFRVRAQSDVQQNSYLAHVPWKHIWTGAKVVATFSFVFLLVDKLRGRTKNVLQSEGLIPSGSEVTRRVTKHRIRAGARVQNFNVMEAHGSVDPNAVEFVNNKLARSVVRAAFPGFGMFGTMVSGFYLAIPSHFFVAEDGNMRSVGSVFSLTTISGAIYNEAFNPERLVAFEDRDVCLYVCSFAMRPFKDLSSHLIKEEDLPHHTRFACVAVLIANDAIQVRSGMATAVSLRERTVSNEYSFRGEKFYCQYGWNTNIPSQPGDCGSPLVAFDSRLQSKLVGIHTAGLRGVNHAFFDLITYEMFCEAKKIMDDKGFTNVIGTPVLKLDPQGALSDSLISVPGGNFAYFGVIEKQYAVHIPTKSDIVPSVIYDKVFKHVTEPSVLTPRDPRLLRTGAFPLLDAVEEYGVANVGLSPSILEQICESFDDDFAAYECLAPRRVYTIDEAISGFANDEYADRLNIESSAGFYFSTIKKKGTHGKEHYLEDVSGILRLRDNEESLLLRKMCLEMVEKAKRGVRSPNAWSDMLKDERRSLVKVEQGRTRLFTMCNIMFTIVFRQYFLAFCAAMYRAKLKGFSAVGINPYSYEWTLLARALLAVSQFLFDGDYRFFDKKVPPEIIENMAKNITNWYGDGVEGLTVRRVLLSEFPHCVHILLNLAFATTGGQPSGEPATVQVNCYVNESNFRYAWLVLAPIHLKSLVEYKKNVRTFVYGDDNIVAVAPEVKDWYNFVTVKEVFLKYLGMEYTNSAKDDSLVPYKSLEECTFLKNGFRKDGTLWKPTMALSTIHELTNWIRESADPGEQTVVNCNNALRFAYFHPQPCFTNLRKGIAEALTLVGVPFSLLSYGALDLEFRADCFSLPGVTKRVLSYLNSCQDGSFNESTGKSPVPSSLDDWLKCGTPMVDTLTGHSGELSCQSTLAPKELAFSQMNIDENEILEAHGLDQTEVVPIKLVMNEGIGHQDGLTMPQQSLALSNAKSMGELQRGELGWDYRRIVARDTFVGIWSWTPAMSDLVNIFYLDVPNNLLTTTATAAPFQSFQYSRADTIVTIRCNTTQFHQGQLIVVWFPMVYSQAIAEGRFKFRQQLDMLPHVKIDASRAETVSLRIPFTNNRDYWQIANPPDVVVNPISTDNSSGAIACYVWSPLFAPPSASTTATLSVWARFENAEFKVPIPVATVTASEVSLSANHGPVLEAQGNTYSSVSNKFGSVQNASLPNTVVGPQVDTRVKANTSMLDKPNWSAFPPRGVRCPEINMAGVVGVESLDRLTAYPGSQTITTFDMLPTTVDETTVSCLVERYVYLTDANFTSGATINTPLSSGLIGPTASMSGFPVITGGVLPLTLLDYISTFATLWRGSLKFKISLVQTPFHNGRLFFGIHLGQTIVPATLPGAFGQYGIDIDLAGTQRDFEIEVPFEAPTAWRTVGNGVDNSLSGNDYNVLQSFTGVWSLRAITTLGFTAQVNNSVRIFIYAAGGRDFELSGLYNGGCYMAPINGVVTSPIPDELFLALPILEAQGLEEGRREPTDDLVQTDVQVGTVPVDHTSKISPIGEKITSLLDVCRRYTLSWTAIHSDVKAGLGQSTTSPSVTPSRAIWPGGNLYTSKFRIFLPNVTRPILNNGFGATTGYIAQMPYPLAQILNMYKLYRGSLRIRIKFAFGTDCKRAYAAFRPAGEFGALTASGITDRYATGVRNYSELQNMQVLNQTEPITGSYWDPDRYGLWAGTDTVLCGGGTMATAYPDAPEIAIEIPFSSIFNWLENADVGATNSAGDGYYGEVLVGTLHDGTATNQGGSYFTTGSNPWVGGVMVPTTTYNAYVCVADDFRPAIFWGFPQMQLVNQYSLYPPGPPTSWEPMYGWKGRSTAPMMLEAQGSDESEPLAAQLAPVNVDEQSRSREARDMVALRTAVVRYYDATETEWAWNELSMVVSVADFQLTEYGPKGATHNPTFKTEARIVCGRFLFKAIATGSTRKMAKKTAMKEVFDQVKL